MPHYNADWATKSNHNKENVPPRNLKDIPNISKSLFNDDKRAKGTASSKKYISQQQLVAKTRSGRRKQQQVRNYHFAFANMYSP